MRILLDIIFNHSGSNWRYPPDTPGGANDGNTVGYTTGRHPFGDWNDAQGQPDGDASPATRTASGRSNFRDVDDYTRAGSGNLGAGDIDDSNAEHKRSDFMDLRDFDLDNPVAGSGNVLGALAACYKYWIALTDCDGFRIDTLKHVTPGAGAQLLRLDQRVRRQYRQEQFLPGRRDRRRRFRRGPLPRRSRPQPQRRARHRRDAPGTGRGGQRSGGAERLFRRLRSGEEPRSGRTATSATRMYRF